MLFREEDGFIKVNGDKSSPCCDVRKRHIGETFPRSTYIHGNVVQPFIYLIISVLVHM